MAKLETRRATNFIGPVPPRTRAPRGPKNNGNLRKNLLKARAEPLRRAALKAAEASVKHSSSKSAAPASVQGKTAKEILRMGHDEKLRYMGVLSTSDMKGVVKMLRAYKVAGVPVGKILEAEESHFDEFQDFMAELTYPQQREYDYVVSIINEFE